jgi:hypothetical protein
VPWANAALVANVAVVAKAAAVIENSRRCIRLTPEMMICSSR